MPVPAWRYNPMVERKPRAKPRHPRPQCPPLLSRWLRGQRVPTSPARRPDPTARPADPQSAQPYPHPSNSPPPYKELISTSQGRDSPNAVRRTSSQLIPPAAGGRSILFSEDLR
jgi:hypothetical protein